VDGVGEEFFACAAFAEEEDVAVGPGGAQGKVFGFGHAPRAADNVVEAVTGYAVVAAEFAQFPLVARDLLFELLLTLEEVADFADVFEKDFADGAGYFAVFEYRDAVDDDLAALEVLDLAEFWDAGAADDVEAGVFDDVGDEAADDFVADDVEDVFVGFVYPGDDTVPVDDDDAVADVFEDGVEVFGVVLGIEQLGEGAAEFGGVLEDGQGADDFAAFEDGRAVGEDDAAAVDELAFPLGLPGFEHPPQAGVGDDFVDGAADGFVGRQGDEVGGGFVAGGDDADGVDDDDAAVGGADEGADFVPGAL
jgi:hypothetical protein